MNIFEKTIAFFSPLWALKRNNARNALVRSAYYAAAKTGRLTNPNTSLQTYNVNKIIGNSSATIKARVQQLSRDFPYFARAINAVETFVVGSGIQYQARVLDSNGKLDQKINQQIEDAFNFWADQADSAGKLHFYEIQALLKRQDLEAGEFFVIKQYSRKNKFIPYQLKLIESDYITSGFEYSIDANISVDQGIEYNKLTGETLFYYVEDDYGAYKKFPASQIFHGFKAIRPEQLRGISPFAPGIVLASDLSDYMQAEIDTAKMAAKYLTFVTSPDPLSRQTFGAETDTDTGNKVEEIENAIIEYLRPGEEIKIASNPRPGTNLPPFVKLILTMFSISSGYSGVPYEIVSGDYSGVNWATLRTSRNDFRQFLIPEQSRMIRQICNPALRDFMDIAVMTGRLNLPGYFNNPYPYYRAEWQPPGMQPIDALKETKAAIDQLKYNLISPQKLAKERGMDLENIYQEIEQANELKDQYGIVDTEVSLASANNPVAVMDQDEEEDMDDE